MKRTIALAISLLVAGSGIAACGKLATSVSIKTTMNVGPGGGTVSLEKVTVEVPPGALEDEATVTIRKTNDHPPGNVGPAYLIEIKSVSGGELASPAFSKPVKVLFRIKPDEVPDKFAYADLRLARGQNMSWSFVEGSQPDESNGLVSGETTQFSVWSVVSKPECQEDEDCAEGQVCQSGSCGFPDVCNIWDYISQEDLDAVDDCFFEHEMYGPDEEQGQVYYTTVSVAGFVDNQPLYAPRSFFTASVKSSGNTYALSLPCLGMTVKFTVASGIGGAFPFGSYEVASPGCAERGDCECEHCISVELNSAAFGAVEAVSGNIWFYGPPQDLTCGFMGYGFEKARLEFPLVDGKRWWLKLKSDDEERMLKADWLTAMEAALKASPSCAIEIDAELTFYDNTCFVGVVRCNDEHVYSACHMESGEDSLCSHWSVGGEEGHVIGGCDLGGITCEEPEVWDMRYVFDGAPGNCEFCTFTDDKDICTPLEVECGGSQEIAHVASGSEEEGPHPMIECACVIQCDGKSCGEDDECGGTCGCAPGLTCCQDGTCKDNCADCPTVHPWLKEPQTWKCDLPDGTVCSWPAEGCEPGQKPDNVCTCVDYVGDLRFECDRPFHNCLPLEGSDVPEGTLTRPLPTHREVAEECESTLVPRDDPTCSNSQPGIGSPENECTTDDDCEGDGDGARCLDAWQGMGATLCTCYTPDCFEDADCPGLAVCSCGKTDASYFCGGPSYKSCLHECLFSDCRTDADCGEGKFCSPSWDFCGWQIQGYHCHDHDVAECFSSWECMGAEHWGCNFENGEGWICQEIPMCD